jgi:multiple sugar transport system permease protein
MLASSVKETNDQIFRDLRSWRAFVPVGDVSLANYRAVFENSRFPRFFLNSVVVSVGQIVLGLLVNSMAAYALSRLRWKGQKIVLSIIIATLIIPGTATVIPLLMLVSKLPRFALAEGALVQGWQNSYSVMILPFLAGAWNIFLFYSFFQEIPYELDEAALVDGATRFQIFRHVIVPNSGPVFATVAINTFLGSWQMFLWATMTIQSEELRPIMLGLSYFFLQETQWGQVMAYTTLTTLPMLLFFWAFQGAFVRSMATTGLKG